MASQEEPEREMTAEAEALSELNENPEIFMNSPAPKTVYKLAAEIGDKFRPRILKELENKDKKIQRSIQQMVKKQTRAMARQKQVSNDFFSAIEQRLEKAHEHVPDPPRA